MYDPKLENVPSLRQYAVGGSGYIYRTRPYCRLSFVREKIME